MAQQFLDLTGLNKFWEGIKNYLNTKYVAKVDGKGLSTNDYTTAEKNKLASIASNAQANVIETVKLGGTELTVSSKAVNIPVESTLSTSTNPVQTAVVNTAINTLATEVDNKVDTASGDAYYRLEKNGTSITGAATDALKTAVNNANSALQPSNITTGSSNGTISVGGTDVAVKGLGSAAYTASTAYAPSSLSGTVSGISSRVNTLESKVANLASATSFLGITTTALTDDATTSTVKINNIDVTAQKGDVVIYGNSEFIWTDSKWEKLGDTTAESQRITNIENAYVSTFGGTKGAITLDNASSGNVNFSMSGNKLTGTVGVGVTTVGGQSGAITLDTDATAAGSVKFSMNTTNGKKEIQGTVNLPSSIGTAVQTITPSDTTTIDMSATKSTDNTTVTISATAKTGTVTSSAATLTTGKQVFDHVSGVLASLKTGTITAGEGNVTAVITGVSQDNGVVEPTLTSFSAITEAQITTILSK